MRHIVLIEADKVQIEKLLSKGTLKVRTHKRALALQYLDNGKSYKEVSDLLTVSSNTLIVWATNYRTTGLSFLKDKPRSGRPIKFDGQDRAKITALACSEAPDGYAQWSLRLLADRLVELAALNRCHLAVDLFGCGIPCAPFYRQFLPCFCLNPSD